MATEETQENSQEEKKGFEPNRIYTSHSPDSKDFKILI